MFPSSSSVKRFRYVEMCQSQSSASLCDLKVENLRVDCCLLKSKSRWGQIRNQESGIMYVDLTFHQPAGCKLSEATITMDFSPVDPEDSGVHSAGLEVTEYFGPRILMGERRECKISRNLCFNPKVGTPAGFTVEAGSLSKTSSVLHAARWKFTGTRLAVETSKDQTRRSCCRQLVWHLEENKLEQQSFQQPTVHSAVAFHHGSKPFFLDLQIEAKMHRWRDRFKQSLVFPPGNRKSCTRTLIEPSKKPEAGESFRKTVVGLEQTMVEKNLYPVPETPSPRNTEIEDTSEYALRYPPSEGLSAIARDIFGPNAPDPANSGKSVHSDSSSFTHVEPVELSNTTSQDEPTQSTQDDKLDISTIDGSANVSLYSPKDLRPVYSVQELLILLFSSLYGSTSRLLAALLTYLILQLKELHEALEMAANNGMKPYSEID